MEKGLFKPNKTEQKGERLKNTGDFRKAVEEERLDEAENFLNEVRADLNADKSGFPGYDERWLDHREKELFQAFCKGENWGEAKRVVEATKNEASKTGRKNRLEELSGKKYEEI